MVLLWSTELFPSPEDWQDLEGSVYRLVVILLRCLATRHLPHFLHPEENLFRGEAADLASLYRKVESFARDPRRFLRFHFGLPVRTDSWQGDPGTRALLHLPAEDGSYWDTAYFDILLSQVTPDPQLVSRGRARQRQKPPGLGSLGCSGICPPEPSSPWQPLARAAQPRRGGCGRLAMLGRGAQAEWGALSPHSPPASA